MGTLKLERKEIGEFTVYALSGEFVVSSMIDFRKLLTADFAKNRHFFALNMQAVTLIDSSGMGLINNIKKKSDEKNGQLVLYSVPPVVLDNLQQTGILTNLVIVKNEEEFKENFIL